MKRKGQTNLLTDEFTEDLRQTYIRVRKEHLQRYGRISRYAFLKAVAESPARRFYVSSDYAIRVIRLLDKGLPLPANMRPLARDMYAEIYARLLVMRKQCPNRKRLDMLEDILEQPAPSFYITPQSVENKMLKLKTHKQPYERTGNYSKKRNDPNV